MAIRNANAIARMRNECKQPIASTFGQRLWQKRREIRLVNPFNPTLPQPRKSAETSRRRQRRRRRRRRRSHRHPQPASVCEVYFLYTLSMNEQHIEQAMPRSCQER
ncbi:hypothetical protein ACLKA7_014639 [Drosophila subpalustris]